MTDEKTFIPAGPGMIVCIHETGIYIETERFKAARSLLEEVWETGKPPVDGKAEADVWMKVGRFLGKA